MKKYEYSMEDDITVDHASLNSASLLQTDGRRWLTAALCILTIQTVHSYSRTAEGSSSMIIELTFIPKLNPHEQYRQHCCRQSATGIQQTHEVHQYCQYTTATNIFPSRLFRTEACHEDVQEHQPSWPNDIRIKVGRLIRSVQPSFL